MKRLSIFVSGHGTNLQRIAEYFLEDFEVEIVNGMRSFFALSME